MAAVAYQYGGDALPAWWRALYLSRSAPTSVVAPVSDGCPVREATPFSVQLKRDTERINDLRVASSPERLRCVVGGGMGVGERGREWGGECRRAKCRTGVKSQDYEHYSIGRRRTNRTISTFHRFE